MKLTKTRVLSPQSPSFKFKEQNRSDCDETYSKGFSPIQSIKV